MCYIKISISRSYYSAFYFQLNSFFVDLSYASKLFPFYQQPSLWKALLLVFQTCADSLPSTVLVGMDYYLLFCIYNNSMALPKYDISIPWFAYICRDVLPFTLELPEAIAKASSHKQLESISHMGVGRYKIHSLLKWIAGLKEAVL